MAGIEPLTVCSVYWCTTNQTRIFMDGCIREIQSKVGNVGASLKINRMGWVVVACLLAE